MLITKADGTEEEFKPNKLRNSLRRSGAGKDEIEDIVRNITDSLTPGMTTGEIYRRAFDMLQTSMKPTAARYSLRRALFGLGPTGFPFEDFLMRLFEREGYDVRARQVITGTCATHEVDLAAFREDSSFVAEAKFHMRPGIKSDLQVALYSYARFLDLRDHPVCGEDTCGIESLYVITNTKFTSSAEKYAECVGLNLLSWAYPHDGTLQDRIEKAGLYPITVLSALSNKDKQNLLAAGAILCSDILKNPGTLERHGISSKRVQAAVEEAEMLCKPA